jgi:extradiol dioxygenase family protein
LDQLKKKKQAFIIEPKIRFEGQPGEQRTMFLKDPSGNALEFKAFKNLDSLFRA